MAPKIESAKALKKSAEALSAIKDEYKKPWYKKGEYWVGIIVNIIAIFALLK